MEATSNCHVAIVECHADSWHFVVAGVPRRVGTKVGVMVETQVLAGEIQALEYVREDSLLLKVVGTCKSSEIIRITAAECKFCGVDLSVNGFHFLWKIWGSTRFSFVIKPRDDVWEPVLYRLSTPRTPVPMFSERIAG